MKTYQLKFLAWTFSAFLPHEPDGTEDGTANDLDYYELLGVPKDANGDDIKKAYKKRSLEIHPDKLRQRGMRYQGKVITEDEARVHFQHMKAAYDALSDKKKRQIYDALGHKGMVFVINPSHAWDPHILLGNLAKSSVWDRVKLMTLVLLFFGLALLQPILVCAKVDQILSENGGGLVNSSWVTIFIPTWIFSLIYCVILIIGKAILPLFQWISVVIGVLLLTLKWDNSIQVNYSIVFIPFYLLWILRGLEAKKEMEASKRDMSKMVTMKYIEKYIINERKEDDNLTDVESPFNRTYNDLTVEERDEINKSYIIVHSVLTRPPVPGQCEGQTAEESMEEELNQIESSPEYQEARGRYQAAYKSVQNIILPEIPFIILVIIQLDLNKHWNWGWIFFPVWISMILDCCGSCYGFFCTSALAHIEVQESMAAHFNKNKNKNGDVNEEKFHSKDDHLVKTNGENSDECETKISKDSKDIAKKMPDVAVAAGKESVAISSEEKGNDTVEELKKISDDSSLLTTEADTAIPVIDPLVPEIDAKLKLDDIVHDGEGDKADDDDYLRNFFSMDEDTFQYYQQAEQEADMKAKEAQSKAIGAFCKTIFQIIIIVLFVVKLNEVNSEQMDPDLEDYSSISTFWIIFPLLLLSGCTTCCCCCAIFCAAEVDNVISSEQPAETDTEESHNERKDDVLASIGVVNSETSEGMELDIVDQLQDKSDEQNDIACKKESNIDDLD